MKYIQKTFDDRHIVKVNGTNIVVSYDDIELLIPLLKAILEGEATPMFPPHQSETE